MKHDQAWARQAIRSSGLLALALCASCSSSGVPVSCGGAITDIDYSIDFGDKLTIEQALEAAAEQEQLPVDGYAENVDVRTDASRKYEWLEGGEPKIAVELIYDEETDSWAAERIVACLKYQAAE